MARSGSYVYVVKVDGLPRYVGKGTGRRTADHMRKVRSIIRQRAAGMTVRTTLFYGKLAAAFLAGAEIDVEILMDGMTDAEAFAQEAALIEGAPEGQLWNGRGGGTGYTSEQMKALWRDPEFRSKCSRPGRSRPLPTEILRDRQKAKWRDPAFREKALAGMKRRDAGNITSTLLALIRAEPGLTAGELQARMTGKTLKLHRLVERGEIVREGGHNGGRYFPAALQ